MPSMLFLDATNAGFSTSHMCVCVRNSIKIICEFAFKTISKRHTTETFRRCDQTSSAKTRCTIEKKSREKKKKRILNVTNWSKVDALRLIAQQQHSNLHYLSTAATAAKPTTTAANNIKILMLLCQLRRFTTWPLHARSLAFLPCHKACALIPFLGLCCSQQASKSQGNSIFHFNL